MLKGQLYGFDEYAAFLRNVPKVIKEETDFAFDEAAMAWVDGAVRAAPVDQGRLKQSIRKDKTKTGYEVSVGVEYAAFLEWGTKTQVKVPTELQEYAQKFKGAKGSGGDVKRIIFAWCKRVGIPPERWFLVYRSIMIKGIKPNPFFFTQRTAVERQLMGDLQQILETI